MTNVEVRVSSRNEVRAVSSFVSVVTKEEVTVKAYSNNTFITSLSKQIHKCREYAIVHKYGEKGDEIQETKVKTGAEVIDILMAVVPHFKTKATLTAVLDMFEGKVIVDPAAQPGYYGNPTIANDILGNPCEDVPQYQAMKDHRISTIGIRRATEYDVKAYAGVRKEGVWTFCESDLQGDDYNVAVEYFSSKGIAVIADKQNVSYLTYGNGVAATFTCFLNGFLNTFMPVADVTKTLKRLGSNSASYALDRNAVHTNLKIRGLDGELISYVGAPKMAVIAFDKHFNNGSGVVLSNMGLIEHRVPKTLTNEITIDELGKDRFLKLEGCSLDTKLNSLVEAIKDYLATKNGTVLASGEELVWSAEGEEDIVLASNNNSFPVTIQQKHVDVSKGLPTYRDQVRSVFVKVATVAEEARYNLKGRNGLMKFMTHVKDVVLTTGGELVEDWDLILSPETNKGAICTLAAFASRFIDVDTGEIVNVVYDSKTGNIELDTSDVLSTCERFLGFAANSVEEAYEKYVEINTQTFTLKEEVAVGVVEKYKDFQNTNVQFIEEDGVWYLIETFTGILDYVFPLWEVSTPAECAGINRMGVNDQAVASLYNSGVATGIQGKATKSVVALKHFEINDDKSLVHIDREFDITNSRQELSSSRIEELLDFLARGENEVSPKASLGALINGAGSLQAIRIRYGKTVVDVPLALIFRSPDWNSKGYPTTGFTPVHDMEDSEGVVSYSISGTLMSLLNALKTCGGDALEMHLVNWKYHYAGFISSVTKGKSLANYLKVGKQGHFKVITDYAVPMSHTKGTKTFNMPEIWVSSEFWGLRGNAPKGGFYVELGIRNGDVAIVNRVPVPTAAACVVVVKEDLALDPCVFMVNPIVWSEATLGDCDGDYGYLTPVPQFAVRGYAKAEKFNSHMLSLAGHYRICKAHGSVSPVYDFIGSNGDVKAWAADCAAFKSKMTTRLQKLNNRICVADFKANMASVHDHYKLAVGTSYKYQEFAVRTTVDHFHTGDNITDEMWIEVGSKVYVYEQNALGGWSPTNEERINSEVDNIKAYAKLHRNFSFSNKVVCGRLGQAANGGNAREFVLWLCSSVVKCEQYLKYNGALPANDLHVLNFALRSITRNKSKFVSTEGLNKLYEYINTGGIEGSFFDIHIKAACSVRLVNKVVKSTSATEEKETTCEVNTSIFDEIFYVNYKGDGNTANTSSTKVGRRRLAKKEAVRYAK